jgi:hypothetical protein
LRRLTGCSAAQLRAPVALFFRRAIFAPVAAGFAAGLRLAARLVLAPVSVSLGSTPSRFFTA